MDDTKSVIQNLCGPYEVETAIVEFQKVIKNDGSDVGSRWLDLVEEPYSRG